MRVFRVVLTTFLLTLVAVSVQAQSQLSANVTSAPTTIQVQPAKNVFAVIDSAAFSDEKAGITRVVTAMKQVDSKFEPLRREIKTMQDQLAAIQADIQKKQATESQAVINRLVDQGQQLEIQIKRKTEDAQSNFQKELNAALDPLQVDITNSLNAFAQSRGILMIIDSNRVPVIYVHATIDITKDFIAEYNRTHPAGTPPATTPARP